MAGVGIQQTFILIFLLFAIKLHVLILREGCPTRASPKAALYLLYTVYAVLFLITVLSPFASFSIQFFLTDANGTW